jgi:hypothetical protein
MSNLLATIRNTKAPKPPRLVLYGEHKVGKSSFAASAPNPIFIQTEDGLDALNVNAFPLSTSFEHVMLCINELQTQEHNFQSVVIDSLDWLEDLIHTHVCKVNGKQSIEDFGYGKGYTMALDFWGGFLASLNQLRLTKNMAVILICHEQVKRFDNPAAGASYDRYQPKMREKAADKMQEWADAIGFAAIETHVNVEAKTMTRFVNPQSSQRILHLQESPAFVAGNRYGMPAQIPLEWNAFITAFMQAFQPTQTLNQ